MRTIAGESLSDLTGKKAESKGGEEDGDSDEAEQRSDLRPESCSAWTGIRSAALDGAVCRLVLGVGWLGAF